MAARDGSQRVESADLLRLAFVSDPRVQPGGERVAAVVSTIVQDGEDPPRYRSAVHLFRGGSHTTLTTDSAYSDTRPRFSPDGRFLAYLSRSEKERPAQLVLVDLLEPAGAGASTEPRILSEEAGGVEAFDWHPDSKRIAVLTRGSEPSKTIPVSRTVESPRYKSDGKGYLPEEPRRLVLIEAPGGDAARPGSWTRVPVPAGIHSSLDIEDLVWSSDGLHLLLIASADRREWEEFRRRLWRLEVATGDSVSLTDAEYLSSPAPSPDGTMVAYVAAAEPGNTSGPTGIWLIPMAGGEPRRLSNEEELAPSLGGDSRYGEHPNGPSWLPDGRLLVNLNSRGNSNLAILEPEGAGLQPLSDEQSTVSAFHQSEGTVAFIREDSSRPGELYRAEVGAPEEQLTSLNEDLADRCGFQRAVGPFTPDEASGASYWRLDPSVPREDGAMVLQVHGGPHTNAGNCFYFEFQLLAARGYTVIYGNPRGSSSYGHDFATSILGAYGSVDAVDVHAFADHALALHHVPDAPIHLTGGSYGGFMTNWLVAHGNRFRSAVTQRSICNFLSFYGTSDIGYHFTERELGGNPWDDFELLWQQSPLRLANRVTTPLLIVHAEADLRCPVEQAQQFFVALKQAGNTDTRLLLLPEEGHELSRSGRPDRRIARLDAIVDWFETHP